jgi:4'-phosphopantetheinyl transferase
MIYLNDDIANFDWQAALPLLSDQRREQCLKFKHEQGRKTCAAAYLLLCEGLRKEYGISEKPVFEYGEHGKPSIVGHPEIFFNMSHCREAAICVLSDKPVGVDIESIRPYNESLARYTMSDEEMALIESAERRDVEFIRLWTLKEAVLKCSGEGIRNDMKHVLDGLKDAKTVINEKNIYIFSVVS